MFDFTRSLLNSFNNKVYYRGIPNIKTIPTIGDNNSNDLVKVNENEIEKIKNLETTVRENNKQTVLTHYTKALIKKIFLFYLPCILLILTTIYCFFPSKTKKNKNVDKYIEKTIHIDSEKGCIVSQKYAYHSHFGVPVDKTKTIESSNSYIDYRITDGDNTINANLYIQDSGKLKLHSVTDDVYINNNDYDSESYEELDSQYEDLYNQIMSALQNDKNGVFSKKEREILKKINENDKKRIFIDMVNYIKQDEVCVEYIVSRWWKKGILFIFCLIYAGILIWWYRENGIDADDQLTYNNDGKIIFERYDKTENIFNSPSNTRNIFIAAENTRINNIYDLAEKNIENPKMILTGHEKRLIKRRNKLRKK